ncbi:MAG TPA: TonB family protein [Rhizobium sp.]
MAPRSVKVSIERRRSGDGLNDNYPSVLPGHELAGLDGLPRPPTAEAVSHYSRFTQIGSYPVHPTEPAPDASEPPVMDMLSAERPDKAAAAGKKSIAFAGLGSCLFHAAVIAALLVAIVAAPEEAQEEAGDTVSVVMIGNSDMDQMAAGEESPQKPPEEVTAEAVQPETVQPTEVKPEEVQPAEAEAVQPTETEVQPTETAEAVQPTEQVSPETVTSEQPQVLATQAPAETTVVQPAETVQAVEPTPEVITPVDKPVRQAKPVEKPREVVKKPVPKVVRTRAGSNGESQQDSKRGSVEGTETSQSNTNSLSDARRTGSGNAAVANYPGKVQARIRRAVRLSSKYEKGMTVRVRLTIAASGELASLSVARSSGIPELDGAVTDGVRRAAPFPPLPSEWGKPSWTFTQEVQVTGR